MQTTYLHLNCFPSYEPTFSPFIIYYFHNRVYSFSRKNAIRYCSRIAQTATDFADASHSKSAKSAAITVSYGIFSSENAYPCTVTAIRMQHRSKRKTIKLNVSTGLILSDILRYNRVLSRERLPYRPNNRVLHRNTNVSTHHSSVRRVLS